ncbi:geranylgeranylglyceryl/heptaprenylglyceryl phosphate synthase [Lacihabitans lacunae]|jgi:phosphoglycerol geranylgeranyltransferase|uniref:Geranylgeranylglyceryl phosphate synthase n=1 Tax=Lacihabitans lacunae TaxID=1028214 RepID=A0ABV7YR34_9BACT
MFVKNKRHLAILLDPDKAEPSNFLLEKALPDYFFIGGSFVSMHRQSQICISIKKQCSVPLVLFPADPSHLTENADALLFLSLVSGRNPEYLIGKHVIAAPMLRKSKLKILPTAYMLIDGGEATSASYISNSNPIPYQKSDIALATALAAQMLGMKYIYLDCGSGAPKHVNPEMIKLLKDHLEIPIIVGGGIRTPETLFNLYEAGADVCVVGNILEKNPSLYMDFIAASK